MNYTLNNFDVPKNRSEERGKDRSVIVVKHKLLDVDLLFIAVCQIEDTVTNRGLFYR